MGAGHVKGTVVVNMLTLEVAVEDIETEGEKQGLPTAHERLLKKEGWKRHYCFGAAVQNGTFRPVSGHINGVREGYRHSTGTGCAGGIRALGTPHNIEPSEGCPAAGLPKGFLTLEQKSFRENTKRKEHREKACIPEAAKSVALRLASKGGGREPFSIEALLQAEILEHLASFHGGVRDHQANKEMLEQVLRINEQHYGPDHHKLAATLKSLGAVYYELARRPTRWPGIAEEEKELLLRALRILERHYGPNHHQVAMALVNLGHAHRDLGEPGRAKELCERALRIQEQAGAGEGAVRAGGKFDHERLEMARTLASLGVAYWELGEPGRAKEVLLRAMDFWTNPGYPRDHYQVAATLFYLDKAEEGACPSDYSYSSRRAAEYLEVLVVHYNRYPSDPLFCPADAFRSSPEDLEA